MRILSSVPFGISKVFDLLSGSGMKCNRRLGAPEVKLVVIWIGYYSTKLLKNVFKKIIQGCR